MGAVCDGRTGGFLGLRLPRQPRKGRQTKRRSMRKGNPWLRRAICEAAWGASRTKKSYFHAQFARIRARRGPQRALMAVAHSMIVVGFYLIKYDLQFKDLEVDFLDRRNREHAALRAVKRLNALGYGVILKQVPNAQA
jgi:transposase